ASSSSSGIFAMHSAISAIFSVRRDVDATRSEVATTSAKSTRRLIARAPRKRKGYGAAMQSFASDNNAGIHPRVLQAIEEANRGHVLAYGEDPISARAIEVLRRQFGEDSEPFLVLTGTAANVLSFDALIEPHHAILCAD